MKKNIFIAAAFLTVALTSCEKQESVSNMQLNHEKFLTSQQDYQAQTSAMEADEATADEAFAQ